MGHLIIPTALACAGFLVTFTVRSWHEGLWRPGQATDQETVSTPRQPAAAHSTSIAPLPLESIPQLASVIKQEVARSRAAQVPATSPALAPTDAPHYLAERDRETAHSGRMR
jgi:hypothetical protein